MCMRGGFRYNDLHNLDYWMRHDPQRDTSQFSCAAMCKRRFFFGVISVDCTDRPYLIAARNAFFTT